MITSQPPLRAKMASQPTFGTFIKLGRREVVEIVARAGFDFAICDLEHSQISEQDASHLIVGGIASGLPIIVRLASFDAGADQPSFGSGRGRHPVTPGTATRTSSHISERDEVSA